MYLTVFSAPPSWPLPPSSTLYGPSPSVQPHRYTCTTYRGSFAQKPAPVEAPDLSWLSFAIGERLCRSFIQLRLLTFSSLTTRALASALLRGGRSFTRRMITTCEAGSSSMQRATD